MPNIKKDVNASFKDFVINKFTLRFSNSGVEIRFQNDYFDKSLKIFRLTFFMAAILYALFGLLDFEFSNNHYKDFFIVRYVVVIPFMLLTLLFSFHQHFKKVWQQLSAASFLLGGLGIMYMLYQDPENIYYYGGMFLVLIAGYFFIKLHFIWAVIPGISLLVFYNAGILFFSDTQFKIANVIVTNAFYISANIIALIALYNIELLERKEFYQRFLLSENQKEIMSINQNLESQVEERTKLLNNRNAELEEEIIQRKNVERKLLAAKEKAEESDRLKTAFLTNMSHEIRTPMNGILGFIDLLQDSDISEEEHAEFLRLVNESSNRLLNTINDILEISKIEAGHIHARYSEFQINDVLTGLCSFFTAEANEKGLTLANIEEDKSFSITTDKTKFESILTNLIKNAIKFTQSGRIDLGFIQKEGYFEFFIKDTGVGIPVSRREAIFNRFEQADLAETRGHEGSGLGLSIAKAYVEMLGGKIWVESSLNEGSIFYFTIQDRLERKKVDTMKEKENSGRRGNLVGKTILIAEDDPTSTALIEKMLSIESYNVLVAENGAEVLDVFKANPNTDLILMDIKMPVMDGFEATRKIRDLNKNIPIIAQTAYALEGDKERIIEAGCDYYVSKPIVKKELLKIVRQCFS